MDLEQMSPEILVTQDNLAEIQSAQLRKLHFLNGMLCDPGTQPAQEHDRVRFVEERSVVDRIGDLAELAHRDEEKPVEEYLVVQCFNPDHKTRNDLIATDPKCKWCHGLGLVRVLRDHVPVVRRIGTAGKDEWGPANNIIDQIGDLA